MPSLLHQALAAGLLLVSTVAQPQATPASTLPFARAAHLQHGINASIWFAQSPNYTVARLRSFTTEDDLALMARLGFDHVRLSIDTAPLADWLADPSTPTPFVTELDRVVHAILALHMSVILDIHPEDDYKARLLSSPEAASPGATDQFVALWVALARHFGSLDPDHVVFELLNEPEQTDLQHWQAIETTVLARIRPLAPNTTVIVTGIHYSGLDDLLQLQPLSDPNLIYTFHDYEPFPFTHQGATWTDPRVAPLRQVPYPSTPDNVLPNEQQEPTLAGQLFVADYGLNQWNAGRIQATVAFAARWGALHRVPVYCGEFGVHRPFAPPVDRARWITDMRQAFETNHIGWAMWDFQTNFGLVTKPNGGPAIPNPAIVRALGLHPPT